MRNHNQQLGLAFQKYSIFNSLLLAVIAGMDLNMGA
jgi:hypothetical protein